MREWAALIDRLEQAGYVERMVDPTDRRRVHVRIRPDAIAPIKAVYEPIQTRMFRLWSGYAPRELKVIADFLSRSTDLAVECAEEIRREAALHPVKRRLPCSSRREKPRTRPSAKSDSGVSNPSPVVRRVDEAGSRRAIGSAP